jgi:hypothetical protein
MVKIYRSNVNIVDFNKKLLCFLVMMLLVVSTATALDLGVGLVRAARFVFSDFPLAICVLRFRSVGPPQCRILASDLERDRFPARGLRRQVSGSGFGYLIQSSREAFQRRLVSGRCKNR